MILWLFYYAIKIKKKTYLFLVNLRITNGLCEKKRFQCSWDLVLSFLSERNKIIIILFQWIMKMSMKLFVWFLFSHFFLHRFISYKLYEAFCVISFFPLLPSPFHFLQTGLCSFFMHGASSPITRVINLKS
jgi:hypothetical protein